jgi:hypothetical protein
MHVSFERKDNLTKKEGKKPHKKNKEEGEREREVSERLV